MYSSSAELVRVVAPFVADGLALNERTWYVGPPSQCRAVRAALVKRGIDVNQQIDGGALKIIARDGVYAMKGAFDPEGTIHVFSEAIEQALVDGFAGFRAAADMSWARSLKNGTALVIEYEALLRTLFRTAKATGLCLYDRTVPSLMLQGALATHPLAIVNDRPHQNRSYTRRITSLRDLKQRRSIRPPRGAGSRQR